MMQTPAGRTLSTIYPPPTAKEVMFIQYCMSLQRMFILLTSGTLCVYRIDKDTAILEKLQYPNQLKDSEGKCVSQQITAMAMASSTPPKYDCEIFNEARRQDDEECLDTHINYIDKFLLFV